MSLIAFFTCWNSENRVVILPILVQRYAATGRFPYYLIANTRVPLFRELKNTYNYKYVQGRPADRMKSRYVVSSHF